MQKLELFEMWSHYLALPTDNVLGNKAWIQSLTSDIRLEIERRKTTEKTLGSLVLEPNKQDKKISCLASC